MNSNALHLGEATVEVYMVGNGFIILSNDGPVLLAEYYGEDGMQNHPTPGSVVDSIIENELLLRSGE